MPDCTEDMMPACHERKRTNGGIGVLCRGIKCEIKEKCGFCDNKITILRGKF